MNCSLAHSSAPAVSLRSFAEALMDVTTKKAFFFDFDGALCDTTSKADCVEVSPELPALLGALLRVNRGCVAILAGRPMAEIDAYLAPNRLPGAGQNGLEVRLAEDAPVRGRNMHDLDAVRRCLQAHSPLPKGVEVEDRGLSIALNCRAAPELTGFIDTLVDGVVALSPGGFRAHRGDLSSEISFVGGSKGAALRMLMTNSLFLDRLPVFFGSDTSDGDLVAMVHDLGGLVARVGPSDWDGADVTLSGAADVHWLIRDFIAQHGEEAERDLRSAT